MNKLDIKVTLLHLARLYFG